MASNHNDKAQFGGLPIAETTALTRRITRLSVATAVVLTLVKLAAELSFVVVV